MSFYTDPKYRGLSPVLLYFPKTWSVPYFLSPIFVNGMDG